MGKEDEYGKNLFSDILGEKWLTSRLYDTPRELNVEEGGGISAKLDGVVKSPSGNCAVEIQVVRHKQVLGALVNLALSDNEKKLLVLMNSEKKQLLKNKEKEESWTEHCHYVWERINHADKQKLKVICLLGNANSPKIEDDKAEIEAALKELGIVIR